VEIRVISGDITEVKASAVVVGLFEKVKNPDDYTATLDNVLGGTISQLMSQGEIKGKFGELTIIHSLGKLFAERVVILGLGKKQELTLDKIRGVVAETCRFLQKKGIDDAATIALGVGVGGITPKSASQAITEGALLGLYSFRRHITKEPEYGEIKQLSIVANSEADISLLEHGRDKGKILAEAAKLARDMVNEPANYMTPGHMVKMAKQLAKDYDLELVVLEREKMLELGMGALLGVAQGSAQPPKFIILNYKENDSNEIDLALIGKGITFDSGGISLKPGRKMEEMKGDMAGGAAVIAAIAAISQLKPAINVTAIVPAVENLPGGRAFKPGDILTTMTGKTVEIISTDAEGRLVMADALCFVNKLKPKQIIDVATLTGACVVALGDVCTGAFSNNQELANKVVIAGAKAGELIWQMPMYTEYKELNKSDVADIKNVGDNNAGAITAAQFLAEFVGSTPWVHLDIAGTSMSNKERNYLVKGATGVPVRTLINLALAIAK
jgi:leucyl aminopeptidase